ncbi:MAG: PAS domain-containing protein [Bacteroidetes bacterium]|nr:PAS domain-containing protein [Bacteroidota bacterium]
MLSPSFSGELRLLKKIADSLDQGFMLLDGDLQICYMNAKAEAMVKEHSLSSSDIELSVLAEKTRAGETVSWTSHFSAPTEAVYQYFAAAFDSEDGFSGMLIKMNDITPFSQIEDQLVQSNQRYLLATRASYDMIWERDFGRDRYYFSEALSTVYGYDPDDEWRWQDVMGKLVHPEDRERVIAFVADCYRHKMKIFQCPMHRYLRKDGTILWVDVRCIALYDADGHNIKTVGVTRDISREHYLRANLLHQSAELERSNQELERFVYAASHDLQEPLRMVTNFLGLLQKKYDDRLDEKARQYISVATGSAQRMQDRVKGLLDFARLGNTDNAEPVDMDQLIQDTLKDLALSIEKKHAAIHIPSPLPTIVADKSHMQLLMQNLVGNALTYTDNSFPVIEVACTETPECWQFSVKDNGIGIEEKYHEKIFGIFQRLHTNDQYSGTGIGLAMVKKIVESGGGRIWLDSAPGTGSCFYFTVPKRRVIG